MDILLGGLSTSKLQFLKKKKQIFPAVNFFHFLVIKTLDPDWYSADIMYPDPDSINPDPKQWPWVSASLFLTEHVLWADSATFLEGFSPVFRPLDPPEGR